MQAFRIVLWIACAVGLTAIVLAFGLKGYANSHSDARDLTVSVELVAGLMFWFMLVACVDRVCQATSGDPREDD